METVVFQSHPAVYLIPYVPFVMASTSASGQLIQKHAMSMIRFEHHRFETSDEATIAFLRKHPQYGKTFIELPKAAPSTGAPEKSEPAEVASLKSKNEVIAFLVSERKVSADDLKGKNALEVQKFALDTFNLVFPDWKIPGQSGAPSQE
jgi:hypothetical protein